MLNISKDFKGIKDSNLIVLIKNIVDLEKYSFLNLNEKILSKIDKIFKEQKNTFLKIFLGQEDFEEVVFLFYLDIKEDLHIFLGENISNIPEKITFKYEKDNVLLDSIILGKYSFDTFKEEKTEVKLNIICEELENKNLSNRLSTIKNITDNRDLVNLPGSEKTPDKYVQIIKDIKFKNTKVKIITNSEVKKLGLNLIDAVGKGSTQKPKLVILERIVDKKLPYIGFVGKGVTFDTGGLNVKPGDHMTDMKSDMAGSSTMLFVMKELDDKELDCNIICALAIAENSVGKESYRPGDIIKSYSGQTVEIINTDAEGRLVVADGISYISRNYNLSSITSVATLTGSCLHAVGYNYAGIMGDNREFIDYLLKNKTFESYFELPFDNFFLKKVKGEVSDLVNLNSSVFAGASIGGAFLKKFCINNEKFIHIDMAGIAFVKEKYGLYNKGATGFGVDSLSDLIINYGKTS